MPDYKNVLVVDDDMIKYADRMTRFLFRRGVALHITGTYEDTTLVIKNKCFDLIFLDIGLKGHKTGIDILKELRVNDKKTPIYMITAYSDYEQEAMEAGATGFLQKPFDFDEHLFKILNKNN